MPNIYSKSQYAKKNKWDGAEEPFFEYFEYALKLIFQ